MPYIIGWYGPPGRLTINHKCDCIKQWTFNLSKDSFGINNRSYLGIKYTFKLKINWSHKDRKDMDHMIFINQKYPTYNIPYTSYMIDIIWPISYGRYFRWSISKFRKRNLWKYVAVWFFLIRYSKILTLDNSEFYFCKIGWLFDYSSRFEEKIWKIQLPINSWNWFQRTFGIILCSGRGLLKVVLKSFKTAWM